MSETRTLRVQVHSAKGLTFKDRARINPFVVLSIAGRDESSAVRKNSGGRPFWNDKFAFEVTKKDPILMLQVKHKELFASQLIGFAMVPLPKPGCTDVQDAWVPLLDMKTNAKIGSELHLCMQCVATAGSVAPTAAASKTKDFDGASGAVTVGELFDSLEAAKAVLEQVFVGDESARVQALQSTQQELKNIRVQVKDIPSLPADWRKRLTDLSDEYLADATRQLSELSWHGVNVRMSSRLQHHRSSSRYMKMASSGAHNIAKKIGLSHEDGGSGQFAQLYLDEQSVDSSVRDAPGPPPRLPPPRPIASGAASITSAVDAKIRSAQRRDSETRSDLDPETREHILGTCEAFDDLMDNGYALEIKSKGYATTKIVVGSEVSLKYTAFIWDSATCLAIAYDWSGKDRQSPLVFTGLDHCVRGMNVGAEFLVTITPEYAYGEAGLGEEVPPDTHIVYDAVVLSATDPVGEHTGRIRGLSEIVNVPGPPESPPPPSPIPPPGKRKLRKQSTGKDFSSPIATLENALAALDAETALHKEKQTAKKVELAAGTAKPDRPTHKAPLPPSTRPSSSSCLPVRADSRRLSVEEEGPVIQHSKTVSHSATHSVMVSELRDKLKRSSTIGSTVTGASPPALSQPSRERTGSLAPPVPKRRSMAAPPVPKRQSARNCSELYSRSPTSDSLSSTAIQSHAEEAETTSVAQASVVVEETSSSRLSEIQRIYEASGNGNASKERATSRRLRSRMSSVEGTAVHAAFVAAGHTPPPPPPGSPPQQSKSQPEATTTAAVRAMAAQASAAKTTEAEAARTALVEAAATETVATKTATAEAPEEEAATAEAATAVLMGGNESGGGATGKSAAQLLVKHLRAFSVEPGDIADNAEMPANTHEPASLPPSVPENSAVSNSTSANLKVPAVASVSSSAAATAKPLGGNGDILTVDGWLGTLGLGKYAAAFADLGVDSMDDMSLLEPEDFEDIGMKQVSPSPLLFAPSIN